MDEIKNYSGRNKWPLAITAIVAMILVTGIVVVSIVRDRIVNVPQNQVTVVGQGKISYQPDIANVTLGVQIDKVAKAEDALNQLNDKSTKIVTAIKALGISDADIQTQNYSLSAQYDYVNNVSSVSGYNANEQLVVKVRDIVNKTDLISKVIAEASKAGANQVNGISFTVSNLEDLKQQARVMAIADAKVKANSMASAAGVGLGDIVGWWENFVQGPGSSGTGSGVADGKGGAGGSGSVLPTVPTGSQEIIMEMNLSYKVK